MSVALEAKKLAEVAHELDLDITTDAGKYAVLVVLLKRMPEEQRSHFLLDTFMMFGGEVDQLHDELLSKEEDGRNC